eukprot:355528-Chlamydomonas_euryale.AAC.4
MSTRRAVRCKPDVPRAEMPHARPAACACRAGRPPAAGSAVECKAARAAGLSGCGLQRKMTHARWSPLTRRCSANPLRVVPHTRNAVDVPSRRRCPSGCAAVRVRRTRMRFGRRGFLLGTSRRGRA